MNQQEFEDIRSQCEKRGCDLNAMLGLARSLSRIFFVRVYPPGGGVRVRLYNGLTKECIEYAKKSHGKII
jgi:hypothetical protein